MTTTNELQAIADTWAQELGGKIPVTLRLTVYAGHDKPEPPYFGAEIGWGAMTARWQEWAAELSVAQVKAEVAWRADGAPTNPKEAALAKLRAEAAGLGVRIVEEKP